MTQVIFLVIRDLRDLGWLFWFGLQQFRASDRLWLLHSGFGHSQKVLLVLGKQTLEFPAWAAGCGDFPPCAGHCQSLCASPGLGQLQTWAQGKGSCGSLELLDLGIFLLWAVLELLLLGSAVCVPGNVGGIPAFPAEYPGGGITPVFFC